MDSVHIPEGVISIGEEAFLGNEFLSEVYLPESVEYIGASAFDETVSLTDIYYAGSEQQWKKLNIDENNIKLSEATLHYSKHDSSPSLPPAITSVNISDGKIFVETENVSSEACLFAAVYGKDKELLALAPVKDGCAEIPCTEVETVKIFAWNSFGGLTPLCASKEI